VTLNYTVSFSKNHCDTLPPPPQKNAPPFLPPQVIYLAWLNFQENPNAFPKLTPRKRLVKNAFSGTQLALNWGQVCFSAALAVLDTATEKWAEKKRVAQTPPIAASPPHVK
jgi:hypothetical protein